MGLTQAELKRLNQAVIAIDFGEAKEPAIRAIASAVHDTHVDPKVLGWRPAEYAMTKAHAVGLLAQLGVYDERSSAWKWAGPARATLFDWDVLLGELARHAVHGADPRDAGPTRAAFRVILEVISADPAGRMLARIAERRLELERREAEVKEAMAALVEEERAIARELEKPDAGAAGVAGG